MRVLFTGTSTIKSYAWVVSKQFSSLVSPLQLEKWQRRTHSFLFTCSDERRRTDTFSSIAQDERNSSLCVQIGVNRYVSSSLAGGYQIVCLALSRPVDDDQGESSKYVSSLHNTLGSMTADDDDRYDDILFACAAHLINNRPIALKKRNTSYPVL